MHKWCRSFSARPPRRALLIWRYEGRGTQICTHGLPVLAAGAVWLPGGAPHVPGQAPQRPALAVHGRRDRPRRLGRRLPAPLAGATPQPPVRPARTAPEPRRHTGQETGSDRRRALPGGRRAARQGSGPAPGNQEPEGAAASYKLQAASRNREKRAMRRERERRSL